MLARPVVRPQALCLAALSRCTRHVSSTQPPLIHIQDGTFYKQYPAADDPSNPPLFPHFNFSLDPKLPHLSGNGNLPDDLRRACWAVIGTSGRTELLEILRGQHICIPPTARSYPYLLTDEVASENPRLRDVANAIQYLGFSGEGSQAIGGTRGAYLSARYENHREDTDWTVRQYLRGQTSLNPAEGEEQGTVHDEELFRLVTLDLGLRELLDMPVAKLSNGQTRRAHIAKALLKKPALLLLDDPFMGLDPATRESLSDLLKPLAKRSESQLVLALRPQDRVPDWITHEMILNNSHRILLQGARGEVDNTLNFWRQYSNRGRVAQKDTKLADKFKEVMKSGLLDTKSLTDLGWAESRPEPQVFDALPEGEPLIVMEGVRVQYTKTPVLGGWRQPVQTTKLYGLHWQVRRGQRWAILGANGSGKTTLLSLITSDHPQAYAQPIKLFGHSRLPELGKPGISIFDLQSRLGHSSPEIHAFFPRQLTVRQAVESAFAETFLTRPKLDHEGDLDVDAALRFFKAELDPNARATSDESPPEVPKLFPKIGYYGSRSYVPIDHDVDFADDVRFGELDTAQQRIVLFLRALIHKPDIVLLDEPFSGLSVSQRDKCHRFLNHGEPGDEEKGLEPRLRGLSADQALIMVSHVKEEIPDSVRHFMRLPSKDIDEKPLELRLGMLEPKRTFRDPHVWDSIWLPESEWTKIARRPETFKGLPDAKAYHWFSV